MMWILYTLYYLLSLAAVISVVLPLFRKDHWTFRAFEFPRLQKFFFILGTLLLGFLVMNYAALHFYMIQVVLLACLVYCALQIYPFTPMAPKTVENAMGNEEVITMLISNVYQYNDNFDKLKERIRQHSPDIILLVETDERWREALLPATASYPYKLEKTFDNTYGMLCYSRLEFRDPEIRYITDDKYPSIRTRIITEKGREILFYGLHPPPPSPTEETYSTIRDSELMQVARELEGKNVPAIAAGDLNDVAWSFTTEEFLNVSGMLDPRKGRGIFATFHAEHLLMRWPLDHIFCSPHFRLKKMFRARHIGSDHFPVYVELALKGSESQT